nr:class I SAM-dependent methyltransferase [archaeon]
MNYFDNLRTLYNNPIEIKGFKQLNKKGLFPEEEILIKKHLKPGKKVLVIGCGAGRECFVLAEMGFEVVGVDISKEMVAAAKKLSEKKKLNIKFFESNILDFDYKKESFDYVLMLEQMYNLIPFKKNRLLLLKKVRFLLKKNGLFIFSAYSKLYFHLIFPYLFVKFPQNLIRNLFSSKDKLMHLQQSKYSFSNPKPLSRIKLLKRFFGKVYYALKLFLREPIFLFKNIY